MAERPAGPDPETFDARGVDALALRIAGEEAHAMVPVSAGLLRYLVGAHAGRHLPVRAIDPARDVLDPRQRRAAAILLAAVKFGQEMGATAAQWSQAADVLPGADVGDLMITDRRLALNTVILLVTDLLREIP